MATLADAIRKAGLRRSDLHGNPDQTAYRLFHGYGEGIRGVAADRFSDTAVVSHKVEVARDDLEAAADALLQTSPVCRVIAKAYRTGGSDPRAVSVTHLRGEPIAGELEVRDHGLRLVSRVHTREANGLFLDARPARRWIRENAAGRRILNLFAYTGSLGVAAAAGGARSVVHVDNRRNALNVARRNHLLNGLPIDSRSLMCGDVYTHLPRAHRSGQPFDGIILDPPPQVPARGGRRQPLGEDYEHLASLATPLLAPGGWLLCFFHRLDRTRQEMEAEVLDHSTLPLQIIWRGESGDDFPEADPEHKLRMTAFQQSG